MKSDTLINIANIFGQDINMEFGISKRAVFIMKKRLLNRSEGIKLPTDEVIKNVKMEKDIITTGS